MRVLDATFLVDYLDGVDPAAEYLLANDEETFVLPAPVYGGALVGEGNDPDGDVAGAKADLSWGDVYAIDEDTAATAGEIAGAIGPEGPFLAGMDGIVAAVGRELDAPVVSNDGGLTRGDEAGRRRRGVPGIAGRRVGRRVLQFRYAITPRSQTCSSGRMSARRPNRGDARAVRRDRSQIPPHQRRRALRQ